MNILTYVGIGAIALAVILLITSLVLARKYRIRKTTAEYKMLTKGRPLKDEEERNKGEKIRKAREIYDKSVKKERRILTNEEREILEKVVSRSKEEKSKEAEKLKVEKKAVISAADELASGLPDATGVKKEVLESEQKLQVKKEVPNPAPAASDESQQNREQVKSKKNSTLKNTEEMGSAYIDTRTTLLNAKTEERKDYQEEASIRTEETSIDTRTTLLSNAVDTKTTLHQQEYKTTLLQREE